MTPGLIVNENFPAPSTQVLRAAGLDVLAVGETHSGMDDRDVLALAREQRHWLVTFDTDCAELYSTDGCRRHRRFCCFGRPITALSSRRNGSFPLSTRLLRLKAALSLEAHCEKGHCLLPCLRQVQQLEAATGADADADAE